MKIKSISIKKFRAFKDISFEVGKKLTIIAGQNGTQKTTLLGLLTQPFSITDKDNPIYGEKPLCGGNYKSAFSEKFKLSEDFDLAGRHEWTLNLDADMEPFTVESIARDKDEKKIRFWKKGKRDKGSGYLQLPVIFLSLSRLLPIGEVQKLFESTKISLTDEEHIFYQDWHNKILLMPGMNIEQIPVLESSTKITAGVNTSTYDWRMNSAGQDDLGKILLAILSFKRLKEKYPDKYTGGILAIDEMDATLFPASQIKLFNALLSFASQYNLQIFCTTHSLSILQKVCGYLSPEVKVIFLQKVDNSVIVKENISFTAIKDNLNVTLSSSDILMKKDLFTEDKEAFLFFKGLLKSKIKYFKHANCALGCNNLIDLITRKVKGFCEHDSIIVFDGDILSESKNKKKLSKFNNYVILPGGDSPERVMASYLFDKNDIDSIWDKICEGYNKQLAFRDCSIDEIKTDRKIAKKWFNEQIKYWGRDGARLFKVWGQEHKEEVTKFITEIMEKYKL